MNKKLFMAGILALSIGSAQASDSNNSIFGSIGQVVLQNPKTVAAAAGLTAAGLYQWWNGRSLCGSNLYSKKTEANGTSIEYGNEYENPHARACSNVQINPGCNHHANLYGVHFLGASIGSAKDSDTNTTPYCSCSPTDSNIKLKGGIACMVNPASLTNNKQPQYTHQIGFGIRNHREKTSYGIMFDPKPLIAGLATGFGTAVTIYGLRS